MTTNFFHPPLLLFFWIRDPESGMGKNQDPGSATLLSHDQLSFQLVTWILIKTFFAIISVVDPK
jgi:hypothetical protein